MGNVKDVHITLIRMKQDLPVNKIIARQIKFLTSKGSVKIAKITLTQIKNNDHASQILVIHLKI